MGKRAWRFLLAAGMSLPGAIQAQTFAPYKDELFAYPEPVAVLEGGARLDVPYSEARDIDARDEIPERRVKRAYVDLSSVERADEQELQTPDGALRYSAVGAVSASAPVVVFVHGRNGDRRLGLNDWSFGGNFNRLKNLLVRARGQYLTVDGGALGDADAARIGTLLEELKRRHPSSPLVLACASMGGQICWTLARGPEARSIDAMILLGSDSTIERFTALQKANGRAMPILVAHGTRDKVYAFDRQLAFFETVRKQSPAYPIRFVGFDGGNHGTPVRMVDWRDALNWIACHLSPAALRGSAGGPVRR